MHGFLVLALLLTPTPASLPAEDKVAFDGLELTYLGLERVTNYRELSVKNDKKEELALVRLAITWTESKRRLVLKDSDIRLHEPGGKGHDSAFHFVQALAEPGETTRTIEIPFRVTKGARFTTLRIGKSFLRIEPLPEK